MNVEIISINDESGSMFRMRQDLIGSFNSFLADQKAQPGQARLTLVKFNHEVKTVYQARDLHSAPALTDEDYCPGGDTALNDAIGMTLEREGKRIAAEGWADKVIVTINTDGEDNASKAYTIEQVRQMVAHAEGHGWTVLFQGVGIDAFQTGQKYGISAATTASYAGSGSGLRTAYADVSAMTTVLRSAPV